MAVALTAGGALSATAAGAAEDDRREPAKPLRAATSGPNSERIELMPIRRSRDGSRKVAISLGPDQLPTVRQGDRLVVNGEITLSTTCVMVERRCRGKRYSYSPRVGAQLVLADSTREARGKRTVALSPRVSVRCGQRRPNRNHHCPLAIGDRGFRVPRARDLPCRPAACHVNLVVDAHSRRAVDGNKLIIGADEPDGSIDGGKGRVNAIVIRAGGEVSRQSERTGAVRTSRLPMPRSHPKPQKVVYSAKLPHLRAGDVISAESKQITSIGHLRYAAFVGSRIVVATRPTATETSGKVRKWLAFGPNMTERNGFNCTQGPSAFRTPCAGRKAGLARVANDVLRRNGRDRPLYVNLVARTFPKLTAARSGDAARILRGGWLRVTRYSAGRPRSGG